MLHCTEANLASYPWYAAHTSLGISSQAYTASVLFIGSSSYSIN